MQRAVCKWRQSVTQVTEAVRSWHFVSGRAPAGQSYQDS